VRLNIEPDLDAPLLASRRASAGGNEETFGI
jgi:hypothetical protein